MRPLQPLPGVTQDPKPGHPHSESALSWSPEGSTDSIPLITETLGEAVLLCTF